MVKLLLMIYLLVGALLSAYMFGYGMKAWKQQNAGYSTIKHVLCIVRGIILCFAFMVIWPLGLAMTAGSEKAVSEAKEQVAREEEIRKMRGG